MVKRFRHRTLEGSPPENGAVERFAIPRHKRNSSAFRLAELFAPLKQIITKIVVISMLHSRPRLNRG
jgi:hypothetical protein